MSTTVAAAVVPIVSSSDLSTPGRSRAFRSRKEVRLVSPPPPTPSRRPMMRLPNPELGGVGLAELSDKVTVGAAYPGGPRGLLATRDIEPGEEVISPPTSCIAFDADYASADEIFGLRDHRRVLIQPEQGRRRHPGGFSRAPHRARAAPSRAPPFGLHAAALPADPPSSPIFFPDLQLEALLPYPPLSLVDDIDAARQEMYTLWDVATAVMERVKVTASPRRRSAWTSLRGRG